MLIKLLWIDHGLAILCILFWNPWVHESSIVRGGTADFLVVIPRVVLLVGSLGKPAQICSGYSPESRSFLPRPTVFFLGGLN